MRRGRSTKVRVRAISIPAGRDSQAEERYTSTWTSLKTLTFMRDACLSLNDVCFNFHPEKLFIIFVIPGCVNDDDVNEKPS